MSSKVELLKEKLAAKLGAGEFYEAEQIVRMMYSRYGYLPYGVLLAFTD